ncbi:MULTISPECIES: RidA family protein [Streptococcus]|uniref:Uncharacterized protein n=1 Tax=Streptococcus suis R61 TaxID=996306 RepID=A0AA87F907_STRSU|nr:MULTISPECIES: RidA family protein [Streptococcus]EHC03140.1 hypothetical protein SSUR61_0872 [Streptococcus suis R61]MBY5001542.1 RidA family protein [Streptococcus suis]MBY5012644.1 RidA family protein [Streptococcus suis]MBY5019416.1 RidA family protein [Streptococcus suis]MBY5024714.1 RidA family protein [Streptococcus suis]
MNIAIKTNLVPEAIGPYSTAIETKGNCQKTVYVSGQLPIDVATGEFAGSDIKEQTTQSLKNLRGILNAADMDLSDVVKTTVFLSDITEFAAMNEVYGEFFAEPYPARSAFQVAALPKNARVEIEAIAVKSN